YIPEVVSASFSVINSTLKVVNDGNVPYKKSVEVTIGDSVKIVDVNLPVGGVSRFSLYAPDGVYDIKVRDGSVSAFDIPGVSLTGNSVQIFDYDSDPGILTRYPVVWFFIIGVLGLFIFGVSRSMGMKKLLVRMPKPKIPGRRSKEFLDDST